MTDEKRLGGKGECAECRARRARERAHEIEHSLAGQGTPGASGTELVPSLRQRRLTEHTRIHASCSVKNTFYPLSSSPTLNTPMLLFHLIPLSLLAVLPYSLASPNEQFPFHPPHAHDRLSTTLVDKLSEDPDYTTLLRLLQRARLIPTINRLNGATLFAPTNDAIHRHTSFSRFSSLTGDNINEQLRQELFYHLLNYTIVLPKHDDILVAKTLHFPRDYTEPPSQDPPPSPPWLPIPGGSLGGEPQRLRVGARKEQVHVGVDALGQGGARVIKAPVDAGNGLLVGIDSILSLPPSLGASGSSLSHVWI